MALFFARAIGWLFLVGGALLIIVGVWVAQSLHELSIRNLAPILGYAAFLFIIAIFLLKFIQPNKQAPPSDGGSA